MQDGPQYAGAERREHRREHTSGSVSITAYFGNSEHRREQPRDYKDYYSNSKYYRAITGTVDLIDISYSGVRVKTSLPLERDCIVELNSEGKQMALVRWIRRGSQFYHAGLMYL